MNVLIKRLKTTRRLVWLLALKADDFPRVVGVPAGSFSEPGSVLQTRGLRWRGFCLQCSQYGWSLPASWPSNTQRMKEGRHIWQNARRPHSALAWISFHTRTQTHTQTGYTLRYLVEAPPPHCLLYKCRLWINLAHIWRTNVFFFSVFNISAWLVKKGEPASVCTGAMIARDAHNVSRHRSNQSIRRKPSFCKLGFKTGSRRPPVMCSLLVCWSFLPDCPH